MKYVITFESYNANDKKYKIKEIETGKILYWTLKEILEEINRDHSDDFTPYDETDWKEGWKEWCEGNTFELLE